MNFSEYQEGTTRTFKEHEPLSAFDARVLDWTTGMSGEVGEVTELIKHSIFHGEKISMMELAKELGDLQWYISAMCKTFDIPLEAIAELNLAKLEHRHGGSFSEAASAERHEKEQDFHHTEVYKTIKTKILNGGIKECRGLDEIISDLNSCIKELEACDIPIIDSQNGDFALQKVYYDEAIDEVFCDLEEM